MMAENLKGKRRDGQEWRAVVGRFAGSGLGVEAFCEREGVSRSSFGRWRSFLADTDLAGGAAAPAERAGFVDAGLVGLSGGGRLEVRLDLGGGVVLHVLRG
jgi:hypothetical protein